MNQGGGADGHDRSEKSARGSRQTGLSKNAHVLCAMLQQRMVRQNYNTNERRPRSKAVFFV